MDIGEPGSLIGLEKAKLYYKESGINFKLFHPSNNFPIGNLKR